MVPVANGKGGCAGIKDWLSGSDDSYRWRKWWQMVVREGVGLGLGFLKVKLGVVWEL